MLGRDPSSQGDLVVGDDYIVVLITAPPGEGERIAGYIIERRLAACVNIVGGVTSIYWWKGSIERGEEELLIVKTRRAALEELVEGVKGIHPYGVPEIIALPIIGGNQDYLDWVGGEVR